MEIFSGVGNGARLRHRITATGVEEGRGGFEARIDLADGARSVVGHHMGELGHARKDHLPLASGELQVSTPDIGAAQ
jgi:hypothetical protein